MSKTLIIAEKPSVALDLSRALVKAPGMTKFENNKDYYENDTHVISSAIGHLVELTLPGGAGAKPKWNFESLPILPEKFALQPIEDSESRLNLLSRLMKRKDVDGIINACDAGREGELIFRYLVQVADVHKPIKRLWMQSMTQGAILAAFSKLRSDEDMMPLANAAMCRSESDWLVGINGTRAMTAHNSRFGGFRKTPVGRVQTPTLAILVAREKEIAAFVPRTYFEVLADFQVAAGEYRGRWIDEGFSKADDPHARAERIWDKAVADAIKARCLNKTGIVSETKKPAKQAPPLLYDLTTLQREASNRFGFSARRTLQLAQALYEKHKVLTYPRTDSRYLPEDYVPTVKAAMGQFTDAGGPDDAFPRDLGKFAKRALDENRIFPSKRIFDDAKVSDHFAITPTGQIPKKLDEAEAKLYDMVTRRFIAVFYPSAEFEVTTRITRIEKDAFKTDGKVLIVPGWLEVYGKKSVDGDETPSLCAAKDGESAKNYAIEVSQETTKPPPHYNEATLLSSMEGAGKLVDDEELREAMSERGLGTPATRSNIIEGLIYEAYIARDQRDLVASQKGIALIDQLHEAGVEALTSPEMTGQWEYKLKQMEQGKLDRPSFMKEIRDFASTIVAKARQYSSTAQEVLLPDYEADCPICGGHGFKQRENMISCKNPECKFKTYKTVAMRMLSDAELRELLSKKFVGPLDGFKNRFGKEFSAALEIAKDGKVAFVFTKTPEQEAAVESVKDTANILCPCPVCAVGKKTNNIYITPAGYTCETHLKEGAKPCKPKANLGRELCKVEITPEQAKKFFAEGSTDLIEKFISKKGRPFKAKLVCMTKGTRLLKWEFPPREAREPAAKKAAKKSSKKAPSAPPPAAE